MESSIHEGRLTQFSSLSSLWASFCQVFCVHEECLVTAGKFHHSCIPSIAEVVVITRKELSYRADMRCYVAAGQNPCTLVNIKKIKKSLKGLQSGGIMCTERLGDVVSKLGLFDLVFRRLETAGQLAGMNTNTSSMRLFATLLRLDQGMRCTFCQLKGLVRKRNSERGLSRIRGCIFCSQFCWMTFLTLVEAC